MQTHLVLGGRKRVGADSGVAERNGRKTLTTVQGLPKKFDQKKILKVIKKKFGEHTNTQSYRDAEANTTQPAMAPSSTTLRWAR